jgi:NAD(P)-dependent dehydrogenase (short-subunit alcohol dehydrogenase family)
VNPLEELFGLRGQVALVVGASSGMGAQAARALARAGADLGLVARRADRLEAVARELAGRGIRTARVPADITADGEIERCFEEVEARLGPPRVLVYAPGVSPLGRAERHAREKWDDALRVNLTGAFEAAQAFARRILERGSTGSIVFVSSVVGSGASPVHRVVGYAAAKGGLDNLTRQLAVEWAQKGIRVNAVAPAYFPTELTIDPRQGDVAPEQRARMETFTPAGRLGRLEELETAILFLAAPASSYVTGAIVPVDGGWTAW